MNILVERNGKTALIKFEVKGHPVTLAVSKGRTSKKEVRRLVERYLNETLDYRQRVEPQPHTA